MSIVSFALKLDGDVSSFTPSVQAQMQSAFAARAGVDPSAVELAITPGSVIVDVSIQTYAATATLVQSAMVSATSSKSSATAMLASVTGVPIAVLAVVTLPTIADVPPPPPPSPSPPPMSPMSTGASAVETSGSIGIIVGIVVGVILAVVLALVFMRRRCRDQQSPEQETKEVELKISSAAMPKPMPMPMPMPMLVGDLHALHEKWIAARNNLDIRQAEENIAKRSASAAADAAIEATRQARSAVQRAERALHAERMRLAQRAAAQFPELFAMEPLLKLGSVELGDSDDLRRVLVERELSHYDDMKLISATDGRHKVWSASYAVDGALAKLCVLKEYNLNDPSEWKALLKEVKLLGQLSECLMTSLMTSLITDDLPNH
jgi:hypothetical protein